MEWLIDSCCSVMVPNTDSGSSAAMKGCLKLGKAASRNGLVTAVSQQCEPWLIEAGKIMNDFDIVFSYVPTVFHRHRSEKKKDVMVDAHHNVCNRSLMAVWDTSASSNSCCKIEVSITCGKGKRTHSSKITSHSFHTGFVESSASEAITHGQAVAVCRQASMHYRIFANEVFQFV